MKKTILFAVAAFFCAVSLSAWEHSLGIEAAAPFFSINSKGDGTKNVFEPKGAVRYFGKARNGFCLSASAGAGFAMSRNFTLEGEDEISKGLGAGLELGAGYAFDIGERFTLALLGAVSFDWLRFTYKKEIRASVSSGYAKAELTQTDDALFAGIGAELLARFKLSNHVSLCGACSFRFLDGGTLWKNGSYMNKDYDTSFDLRGNFIVTPSLGASWTF